MASNSAVLVGVTRRHGQCAKEPACVLGRERRDRLLVPHLDQLTVFGAGTMDHAAQVGHGHQPA